VTVDGVWRKRERPKAWWVGCSGAARRLRGAGGVCAAGGVGYQGGRVEAAMLGRAC